MKTIRIYGRGDKLKSNSFLIYHYNIYRTLKLLLKDEYNVISEFNYIRDSNSASLLYRFIMKIVFYYKTIHHFLFEINKEDILIVTNSNGFYYKMASFTKQKKILICHDDFKYQNKMDRFKRARGLKKIFIMYDIKSRYINRLKKYDFIATISEFTRGFIIKSLPKYNPMQVVDIQNGVDLDIFKPKKYSKPLFQDRFILYVGSEIARKNIVNILKTYKILQEKIPNLKLYKVGKPNNYKDRITTLNLLKTLDVKINKDIHFFDEIDDIVLADLYNHAELLLIPSIKEGFGLPIVEAMACGCPVVTSNTPPMCNIVNNSELVANPFSPEELAIRCLKIMSDKVFKEKIKKQFVLQSKSYSWKYTAKKLIALIKSF